MVLSAFEQPCQVKDIKAAAAAAGFRVPRKWNVSDMLRRSKGAAILTTHGWEITDSGLERLATLGFGSSNPAVQRVARELRTHSDAITDESIRAFVEEAISCHEHKLYRSAIVMSWLGAVAVLYDEVIDHHLLAFNAEAKRRNSRWKPAQTADDLALMKERDFLDILQSISVIGKSVKTSLINCLDRRNGCGHPNSFLVSENAVAAHIEVLILNVFTKYPAPKF